MWCCGISRETWLVVAVLLAAFVAAVSVAMSILVNELEGSGGSPILFLGVILPLILVAVALGLLGAGWVAERRWYAVVLYPRGFAACMSHHCSPWLPRGSFSVGVDIMFSSAFVLWNVGGQVRASASVNSEGAMVPCGTQTHHPACRFLPPCSLTTHRHLGRPLWLRPLASRVSSQLSRACCFGAPHGELVTPATRQLPRRLPRQCTCWELVAGRDHVQLVSFVMVAAHMHA